MDFNKIFFLHIILLSTLFSCNNSNSNGNNFDSNAENKFTLNNAELTFDRIFHDFDTIQEGDIVKTTFKFTNTGLDDLYIYNAVGSCGCTIPKYPKNIAIKPGENSEIEINFDSSGWTNLQSKLIRIYANTPTGSSFIRIQAFVEPKNN